MKFKNCYVYSLDITKRPNLIKLVRTINPHYIIHTAALTNVDYCETHRDEAWKTNVRGTRNLVIAADKIESKVIYVSTDSVFDGKKGMYTEEDTPNPMNFYAVTKLEGEKIVCNSTSPFTIIRTNIYGWNARKKLSIAEWMLNTMLEQKELTLFSDVFFTPTLVNNLANVIVEILEQELSGVYHIAGSEKCSKFHFGLVLAEVFDLDRSLIKSISLKEGNLTAKRPMNPSLSIQKIRKKVKTKLLNVKEGLVEFKSLQDKGYVNELRMCAL